MGHAIPRLEIVSEFIGDALALEKAYEGEALWAIYRILPDEGIEPVKDLIFEMKIRSGAHFYELLEVAEGLGLEVDPDSLDVATYEESLIREDMSLMEALNRLRRHEVMAREFYLRLSESLRKSSLSVDTEAAAERLDLIAEEEKSHAERYEEVIEGVRDLRGKSIRF